MDEIYLDNNATTPILVEVADAMHKCYAQGHANPASQHAAGRRARGVLEAARDGIAAILGAQTATADSDRVLFTSGGTEANNLALRGLAGRQPGRIVISAIEHPSLSGTAAFLQQRGWQVDTLPVDHSGVVQTAGLAELLSSDAQVVSVMLGNNETGVLQPVEQLAAICRKRDVPLHTDATQVVGKLPVDFRRLGVAALTCSAHKFHGPVGIGVLLLRHDIAIDPILAGGFAQGGLRPGTEPVALAVGMHKALEIWSRTQNERAQRLSAFRNRLENCLRTALPEMVVHGSDVPRLPHTLCVAFPGLDRQALLMALDQAGVACSTGSACASGSAEPSPVLLAMGLDAALVKGSIRISLGVQNTASEVDEAARRIIAVCNNLRRRKTSRKMPEPPPATSGKPL